MEPHRKLQLGWALLILLGLTACAGTPPATTAPTASQRRRPRRIWKRQSWRRFKRPLKQLQRQTQSPQPGLQPHQALLQLQGPQRHHRNWLPRLDREQHS